MDLKRHHEDGSIRFAIVSAVLETLPADGEAALDLTNGKPTAPQGPAVSPADLLATDFDVVVRLGFPDGTVRSASAEDAPGGRPRCEDLALRPVGYGVAPVRSARRRRGAAGRRPLGPVPGPGFARRQAARVSVVVENCWDHWAGNIRYDAAVSVGGKVVLSEKAVDHRPLSRWRKVFWWGAGEPGVHIAHDLHYLSSTGALPQYDATLQIPEPTREQQRRLRMEGPDWEILGKGSLTAYMPTTGGRPEIAPYPAWTVEYLLSMDPRRKALVLAERRPGRARGRSTCVPSGPSRSSRSTSGPSSGSTQRGRDRPQWKPDRARCRQPAR